MCLLGKFCCYIMQCIYYSTKDKYTFKRCNIFMWHTRFFKQLLQLGFFSAVCVSACGVCVCVCVCVCVYIVFLMLFRQPPCLKLYDKIFAINWSQIWVFSEDSIKYILSLKNCNRLCKKWNGNFLKKNFI